MTTAVSTESPTIRAGFVGDGFTAALHARAAQSAKASLAGRAAGPARSGSLSRADSEPGRQYRSVRDLLADDAIDVIHICTPGPTHAEFALAALDAGKHVICERPLATSVTDAAELTRRAASAERVASVPLVHRFHPMVRQARERVRAGRLGRLLTVNGAHVQDWLASRGDGDELFGPVAAGGGPSRAFADLGSHLVDLIEFISGDRIVRLNASTRALRAGGSRGETDDAAALIVELASGAIGTLLVSKFAPGRTESLVLELAGTAESMRLDDAEPDVIRLGHPGGSRLLARPTQATSYQETFTAFIAGTYAAIAGDDTDGLPQFADGLRAVTVTDAVLESASSGCWVDVDA